MPKFIIDMWMDGYDTENDEIAACFEFINEQLTFSASGVTSIEIYNDSTIPTLLGEIQLLENLAKLSGAVDKATRRSPGVKRC